MVKIKDFADIDPTGPLPWNVAEDLIVYMKNESDFYRRHLYPMLINVQETVQNGGKFDKKKLLPAIDQAIKEYVKKFEINRRPEDVMTPAEKMECITKLLRDESENFRKGMY